MALAAAVLSPAAGASSSALHPKGLSASLVDGTVTLSWNAPIDDAEGVTGYQILRRRPGVDAVGTFHVVAADTATSEVSFVDRCADQPGTAYTYRVKARRGDQLSRWGNYSRVDLAAGYVSADPQTDCDLDTGAPLTDPDPGNSGDGGNGDGDPDGGEGVVADSAVSVKSDVSYQQSNQDNKQFVPTPDENEGESVVPRSSLQNTDSVQFQDRSALPGLPASYPNALGFDPGAPPAFARADEITGHDASRFAPCNVTAELTDDGILISWQPLERPEWGACASYDVERVPGTQTVTKYKRPDGLTAWKITETGAYYKYTCVDRRSVDGWEIYRTSFGHVYRDGSIVNLSDSQPYLIGTVIGQSGIYSFTDTSRDALVGPRSHIYQMRTLYRTVDSLNPDRDFGSRLSEGVHVFRERDAARRSGST